MGYPNVIFRRISFLSKRPYKLCNRFEAVEMYDLADSDNMNNYVKKRLQEIADQCECSLSDILYSLNELIDEQKPATIEYNPEQQKMMDELRAFAYEQNNLHTHSNLGYDEEDIVFPKLKINNSPTKNEIEKFIGSQKFRENK
jgi:hypothetical protein